MLIGSHIWEHIFGVGVYTRSVLKGFYGVSNGGKLSFSLSYTKAPMAKLHKGINGFFLKNGVKNVSFSDNFANVLNE